MLLHVLEHASTERKYTGSCLRFGASPPLPTPNAERQKLPQAFDLLQHSFGDLADLAGSQEREMKQLE